MSSEKRPSGSDVFLVLISERLHEEYFFSNGKASLPEQLCVAVFISALFIHCAIFLVRINVLGVREAALFGELILAVALVSFLSHLKDVVALTVLFLAHIVKAAGYAGDGCYLEANVVSGFGIARGKCNYIAGKKIPARSFPINDTALNARKKRASALPIFNVVVGFKIDYCVVSAK